MKIRNKGISSNAICMIIVGLMAFLCIFPLWVALVTSFSDETDIVLNGYTAIPRTFSLETYKFLLGNKSKMLINAYKVSLITVVAGTIYTMAMSLGYAYATAQKKSVFPWGNGLSFFAWFTTVFGGGVLPWYILCTRYYGLHNNIYALFIPYGMSVFNMFLLRNNFKAIPEELLEAAHLDGASDWQIFWKIAMPLAKVGIVTVTMFTVLRYWNDYSLALYLTTSSKLYTVQKFLYSMMANISALLSGMAQSDIMHAVVPSNTSKMAMTVLAVLPVVVVFPFAQKYFVKGITVGAVKG